MPFYNPVAWKEAQKSDSDLKRCYPQLSNGTRPGKKEKNLRSLRRYLQIATISTNGILVHRKPNPFGKDYELIIVPSNLASGLISALHIHLCHPSMTQFKKVWNRYFYAIAGENLIEHVTDACSLCTSLRTLPKELMEQGTSIVPKAISKLFACDIVRRENQKIIVLLDLFSLFIVRQFISDERQESLREALLQLSANYKHPDGCLVKVDDAPGFQSLRNDKVLRSVGVTLGFGRVKNKNKNASVDKAIQELEKEIKRMAPNAGQISPGTLALAISNLNHRIRANGLSAKEVLTKRDLYSNEELTFRDDQLQSFRYEKRLQNHPASEICKSHGNPKVDKFTISQGDIVHIKTEGTKHHARDLYLVMKSGNPH